MSKPRFIEIDGKRGLWRKSGSCAMCGRVGPAQMRPSRRALRALLRMAMFPYLTDYFSAG